MAGESAKRIKEEEAAIAEEANKLAREQQNKKKTKAQIKVIN